MGKRKNAAWEVYICEIQPAFLLTVVALYGISPHMASRTSQLAIKLSAPASFLLRVVLLAAPTKTYNEVIHGDFGCCAVSATKKHAKR